MTNESDDAFVVILQHPETLNQLAARMLVKLGIPANATVQRQLAAILANFADSVSERLATVANERLTTLGAELDEAREALDAEREEFEEERKELREHYRVAHETFHETPPGDLHRIAILQCELEQTESRLRVAERDRDNAEQKARNAYYDGQRSAGR